MAEHLSRDDFYSQERRVCCVETNDNDADPRGTLFVQEAKACPFRASCTVIFTEKDFKGLQFVECNHAEKNQMYSRFCPPVINMINRLPG